MSTIIIAFSGASNSGKTTLMNAMKDYCVSKYGEDSVKWVGEVIRREPVDITQVRSNGASYFEKQLEWTGKKIQQEAELFDFVIGQPNAPRLVLIDRSLADSFFYINFYINKSQLREDQYEKYADFYEEVERRMRHHMAKLYTHIFIPYPIKEIVQDGFRYNQLKTFQEIEYREILKNVRYYNDISGGAQVMNLPISQYYGIDGVARWVKDVID